MKKLINIWIIVLVLLPLAATHVAASNPSSKKFIELDQSIPSSNSNANTRVIVQLRDLEFQDSQNLKKNAKIDYLQDNFLAELPTNEFIVIHRYKHIPALVLRINSLENLRLLNNPFVESIQIDQPVRAFDTESLQALQADIVQEDYGITGSGVTVAILDTGIDIDNPDFDGRIIAQQCFTDGDCQPGNVDQSDNADDLNGHGTNVAGVVASNGTVDPRTKGFAPEANLVAVRVLASNGSGWDSDIVAGLDWVYDNLDSLEVKIINLSLGGSPFPENCDSEWPTAAAIISLLNQAGVTIFAASGNAGNSMGISAPACLSNVTAVGASYDYSYGRMPYTGSYANLISGFPDCFDETSSIDTITCFSNSNSMLDLLAPGIWITSSNIGGGIATYAGTSQASPAAAGVAALMLDANPLLTPEEIEQIMAETGVTVTDPKNGLAFPRINALDAILFQTRVWISGPTAGTINKEYIFTAEIFPHPSEESLTYLWESTDLPDQSTTTASYNFAAAGLKTITLTITNSYGSFSSTRIFPVYEVEPKFVHLPMIAR